MAVHPFTSESVTEGHPDKVADQISDAVLDEILLRDPNARVAAETLVTTGLVLVAGEISTEAYVDVPRVVRDTLRAIGYTERSAGFDADTCAVLTSIDEQSEDISAGVDRPWEVREDDAEVGVGELGAGDQGMMFGYACDETPELMPLPISLAHALARRLSRVRHEGVLPYLLPDGKTQVTVRYDEGGVPREVDTVVVSAQHTEDVDLETLRRDIADHVIAPVLADHRAPNVRLFVNPTGRFVSGGPRADTGLTGRKVMVDTYGGAARHGGGAFSGKDPSKVDRSGAYAARHIAKNLVAAKLCRRAEVQVAYAIGVARPVSLRVDAFGTARLPESELEGLVRRHFDLRPAAIIRRLDLRRPLYRSVAAYGHFGRADLRLPWEETDLADALAADAGARAAVR
jgi:S-adenosylmethionine synthetase